MTTTKKKPLHAHGEYMSLVWEDGQDEEYVRGHVTPAEFAAAFDRYHKGPSEPRTVPVKVRHRYGRWSREAGDEDFGNGRSYLRVYDEPGPGRFAITVADYVPMQNAAYHPDLLAESQRAG